MSKSGHKARQRRKKRLFTENAHCSFCNCKLQLRELAKGEKCPDNLAVLHHIFTRLEVKPDGKGKTVLACYKCSQDVSNQKLDELSIEIKRNRALHKNVSFWKKIKGIWCRIYHNIFSRKKKKNA